MSKKRNKKKGFTAILLSLAFIAVAASAVVVTYEQKNGRSAESEAAYAEETVRLGSVVSGVSESGTVTFGTREQTFTVAEVTEVSTSSSDSSDTAASSQSGSSQENTVSMGGEASFDTAAISQMTGAGSALTADSSGSSSSSESGSLEVEEVYVAAGQVVQEGDGILKITQESIDDYRELLEAAVTSAELTVSQEEINVESKQAEADYTYAMYIAEGETAEETYNATITSLENAVAELEEELEEADDEDEIEELEAELQIAENNLTTKSIEAKQTYDNAMTNYKYADQLYAIDTDNLEDDLNDAKEVLEEAQENLADFEEQIGDGVIYAEYSGTVMEVAYAAGDTLSSESAVVTYTDSEDVTMTVSVSQEDISQIATGDEVSITLTAYSDEVFTGQVNSIATSSTTGSSTVNYDVEVAFTGDTQKVYSGMTGSVTFAGRTTGEVLYISNKAVHLDGTRQWVKVKDEDGEIREQEIETGFSNGTNVEVTSGLEEGQTVLIESQVVQ